MFATSSLVLAPTDQSADSSGKSAARASTSERLGFNEALDSALIKSSENRFSVSLSIVQRLGSLPSEKISQTSTVVDAEAKTSSSSEAPADLLTRVNRSKMPAELENLREALGSLQSVLKRSMLPDSDAPDVEAIIGEFKKAVSKFDLESGATLLATLKANKLASQGTESSDWSFVRSSGETDQAATFDLLNLVDWTLSKVKSLNRVVEEGNKAVLSPKPGKKTEKTLSPNTNFSSADAIQVADNSSEQFAVRVASQIVGAVDVFKRADAPMVSVNEVPNGQTVSYVAEFGPTPLSVPEMANDQPVKGQDMAARTHVALTSSGSRDGVSGGWGPTAENTDQPTLQTAQDSRSLGSSLVQGAYPLEDQNTGDFAVTKPKREIESGMALDRVLKAQVLAGRDQVLLTTNFNRTTENTDAQRNALAVNQRSIAEPVVRLDSALQADNKMSRSVDRPSGRRLGNVFDAGEFDPRTQASLAMAGSPSKLGIQVPFPAVVQYNQIIASPSEFGILDSSLFREADILTTPELGQNGLVGGLPAAEAKAERSTLLTAQSSRPTGFSIALTEQMRGITVRDGVTKVQLSPRGLGTIEVEVATDLDDTTNIVIRSDNSVVLSALKDVRDLVSQVLNLDSGGTLNFEESTGNGAQSGEDPQDHEPDVDVSQSGGVITGDLPRIEVISGDVLDITA